MWQRLTFYCKCILSMYNCLIFVLRTSNVQEKIIPMIRMKYNRQQGSRGLRLETSLPAQSLGLWVRFPLEAWMSLRIHSVFVLSCVDSGITMGLIPRPSVSNIHKFILNSEWERPDSIIPEDRRRTEYTAREF
jgi:hypothetical protein